MKLLRAIIYYLWPQQCVIDALKRQVKAQDDMILMLRAHRQSIQNENDKLWAELNKLRG
jgi:Arc/MetJ family transcription regulator